jgi:hypothetical protein
MNKLMKLLTLLAATIIFASVSIAIAHAAGTDLPKTENLSQNRNVDKQLKELEKQEKEQREAEERKKDPHGTRCGCGPNNPCSC